MPKRKAETFMLEEPLNVDALLHLASRRQARRCWPGTDVEIRRLLMGYVHQAKEGWIKTHWKDNETPCGLTRRYSTEEGRSLFALPRVLRAVGRSGIEDIVDVDQINSHCRAQLERHPGMTCLRRYVEDREAALREVIEWAGVSRDDAKHLFLRLLYGGSSAKWLREQGLERLPPFVLDFEAEQREITKRDAEQHVRELEAVELEGASRPEVRLQSYLNMAYERQKTDLMQLHAGARTLSIEHDGLLLHRPPGGREGWKQRVLERIRLVVPEVAIKDMMRFEEAMAELMRVIPGDWGASEDPTQELLIAAALPNAEAGRQHVLYARVVAHEPDFEGRALKEVLKHRSGGEYWLWRDGWREANSGCVMHLVSDVLKRRLRKWDLVDYKASYSPAPVIFENIGALKCVEELLRPLVEDRTFGFDLERRYLVFSNGIYDRDSDTFTNLSPEARTIHVTGWSWEPLEPNLLQKLDEAVLASEIGNFELIEAVSFVPDLSFVFELTGSWERCLYALKHLARATFALPYNEHLWTRGPGSNGKDSLANRMACFLGSYFSNLPCEALTGAREMDAPSETLYALRGKRFVAIREIAKKANIRGHIYKSIADPKGKLKARRLHGHDIEFSPHFLLYLATNVPLEIDDASKGAVRRTRVLDLPFNFVNDPQAANEKLMNAEIESNFEAWNPSFFALLRSVYRCCLMGKSQTNVTPVPADVSAAVEEEMEDEWAEKLREFVGRLEPADAKTASTAAEIREAFCDFCSSIPKREVGLKLAGKGFSEESVHLKSGLIRSTKRAYRVRLGDSVTLVRLR